VNFLKNRKKPEPEIDVGAFSDIAFLLIIFFILTTSIVNLAGNRLQIPSGTTSQSQKEKQKQLTIALKGNRIEIGEDKDNRQISFVQLKLELQKQNYPARKEEERFVILDSADDVIYEQYFQVVMAIIDSGGVLALLEHDDGEKH